MTMKMLGREGEKEVVVVGENEIEEDRQSKRSGERLMVVEEEGEEGSVWGMVGRHSEYPSENGGNNIPDSPRRTNQSGSRGEGGESGRGTHRGRGVREMVAVQNASGGDRRGAGNDGHE